MEPFRFDRIAKLFADRRLSRRQALTQGGAGLAAGTLAAAGVGSGSTQDVTPEGATDQQTSAKVPFLFVQSFQSGSLAPVELELAIPAVVSLGLGATFSKRAAERTPRNLCSAGWNCEV